MADIIFHQQPNLVQINTYLREADSFFTPPLSQHLDLALYAEKIAANAHVLWAVQDQSVVGMCAFYANRPPYAFLTSVSVVPNFQGHGIGKDLLCHLKMWCKENSYLMLSLEVYKKNTVAYSLYKKIGFKIAADHNEKWLMSCSCSEENALS